MIRFPFTPERNLTGAGGAQVAIAAISLALRGDKRFGDMAEAQAGDTLWFPAWCDALRQAIRDGRPVAIGPQVLYANSQRPGFFEYEMIVKAYQKFAGIFTFSRWYQELLRQTMDQKTRHVLLDYPLPRAWLDIPRTARIEHDALIYVKGGPAELRIASALQERFTSSYVLQYGAFTRERLFAAARSSRVCFYISREDHYPLAAVEIGLMGCPIISDEKSCPVLAHRLTGICAPVRERDTRAEFAWAPDAVDRLAAEWEGAWRMDRNELRWSVIRRHDARISVERIADALGESR